MAKHASVIFHTYQREISHSRSNLSRGKLLTMDENETFRSNLLTALRESGMTEAELSRRAGLNRRAVTDIKECRVVSPKLSTVFALSAALGRDPGEMMGLGRRPQLRESLTSLLSEYDEDAQAQLETAIRSFPVAPGAKQ
ncbi:helix-turn-helix domain-containing protein [Rhodovulum visakhapatnamense]|uniref:helix-turn-helix domain-containing protein n=1 Tax=Rhodovulum visakhapatnamense TaxID=364297 RepID=UPI0010648368|nr:helix-turn-helix transcriptional regulator [Rhodovulum visakhapatnamense]